MQKSLRKNFNQQFSTKYYFNIIRTIKESCKSDIDFSIAETPIFIEKDFKNNMLDTCEHIIDFILDKDFKTITERSIPENNNLPGEDEHPQMIVFDFGICKDKHNEIAPQLIEMQGFPSLFGFQICLDDVTRLHHVVPPYYDSFLNGYNKESYLQVLKDIIIGEEKIENVILLEIYPDKQKTKIDFKCMEKMLGIKTICFTKIKAEGAQLFYIEEGNKILIKRIFNRIVFDDLKQHDLKDVIDLKQQYDVTWIPHSNWFYRISKFTLPFLQHQYIPETYFLNEVKMPLPLEDYVLKPLFSYAGLGVIIDVKEEDMLKIKDPENWILQKKVNYAPIIETPDEPAKAEIRLFYFWKNGWERPIAIHNLARLSKGKMIGTRYNENKNWVGGTIAYFEKDLQNS